MRFEGVFTTSSSAHGDVAEQSDARRVAESWFLKWRIARGDRVIRAVLCNRMIAIANPYQTPVGLSDPAENNGDLNEHLWKDRVIVIGMNASAAALWMEPVVIVTIDGVERHSQPTVHWSDHFRFRFLHDGRTVEACVQRKRGFFARYVGYRLVIENESIAESRSRVAHWWRGIAIMLLANLLIFLSFISLA